MLVTDSVHIFLFSFVHNIIPIIHADRFAGPVQFEFPVTITTSTAWQEPMDVGNENSLSVVTKKTENSPKGPLGLMFVHSSILLFVKRVFTRILWSSRFASIKPN